MEILNESPVKLTDAAIVAIKKLISENTDAEKNNLRIGVKGGGCSGMTYLMEFDTIADDDTMYEIDGVSIIMKNAHSLYLSGITIEYDNGLNNRGFTFNNPNASSTCGCGTSFAV
jgi:iron-sulfur cluster assembly accessory protein